MRLTLGVVSGCIEINDAFYLVIEKPRALYEFVNDLYTQINGNDGVIVFSDDNGVLKPSKSVELITTYIPFDVNEKRLLNKINGLLEKEAVNEVNYSSTMELLAQLENYISKLTETFMCSFEYNGLSVSSLIKMCGITIVDDSACNIEKLINYMDVVSELIGDRLFIFVNLTAFYPEDEVMDFIDTVKIKGFQVLIVDSVNRDYISDVEKLIIDEDLCII